MAAKRRRIVSEDIDRGQGATTIPTDSGGTRAATKFGIQTLMGDSVLNPADQSGDFGAQINAAIAALPVTGGTIDARGIVGSQTIASTVTVDRPVTLLLGPVTVTVSASTAFDVISGLQVRGSGTKASIFQQATGAGTIFAIAASDACVIEHITIQSMNHQTEGAAITITGIDSNANANTIIRRNVFSGQWISIDSGNTVGIRIEGNQFQDARYRTLRLNNTVNGDSGDNFAVHNTFSGPDPYTAGAAAIEWIAGGGLLIANNKFFLHDYGIAVNWNTSADTSQFSVFDNHFEAMKDGGGGATISMTRTAGSLAGIQIIGNYITAAGHNVLDVPANSTLWMAQMVVSSNNILVGASSIAFNITGFAAAQGLFNGNHIFGNGSGSQGFNFGVNMASMRVWGNSILGCDVQSVFTSGLHGNYEPDNLGIGLTPDVPLDERISLPTGSYLGIRNAANSAMYKVIGQNASDNVVIGDNSAIVTKIQGPAIISADGAVSKAQINYVQRLTPTITPSVAITAHASEEQVYTVTGLDGQDTVIVQPPFNTAGLGMGGMRCGTNVLAITWVNATAGALTPPTGTYEILAIRAYPV